MNLLRRDETRAERKLLLSFSNLSSSEVSSMNWSPLVAWMGTLLMLPVYKLFVSVFPPPEFLLNSWLLSCPKSN